MPASKLCTAAASPARTIGSRVGADSGISRSGPPSTIMMSPSTSSPRDSESRDSDGRAVASPIARIFGKRGNARLTLGPTTPIDMPDSACRAQSLAIPESCRTTSTTSPASSRCRTVYSRKITFGSSGRTKPPSPDAVGRAIRSFSGCGKNRITTSSNPVLATAGCRPSASEKAPSSGPDKISRTSRREMRAVCATCTIRTVVGCRTSVRNRDIARRSRSVMAWFFWPNGIGSGAIRC